MPEEPLDLEAELDLDDVFSLDEEPLPRCVVWVPRSLERLVCEYESTGSATTARVAMTAIVNLVMLFIS